MRRRLDLCLVIIRGCLVLHSIALHGITGHRCVGAHIWHIWGIACYACRVERKGGEGGETVCMYACILSIAELKKAWQSRGWHSTHSKAYSI